MLSRRDTFKLLIAALFVPRSLFSRQLGLNVVSVERNGLQAMRWWMDHYLPGRLIPPNAKLFIGTVRMPKSILRRA